MTILPDGTFNIYERSSKNLSKEENAISSEIYYKDDPENKDNNIEGVIKFKNGYIYVIKNTELFPLPNIPEIQCALEKISDMNISENEKPKGLRRNDERDKYFEMLLNIKMFDLDDRHFYFSGINGYCMQESVPRAIKIREVIHYGEGELKFDKLLPLLKVPFVYNNRATVIPFPFKYLREFEEILNQEITNMVNNL